MSHSTAGEIWAPVNLEEVYNVLGVTPVGMPDVGYICSNQHGRINKWSKIKPIRYDTPRALQETEFKGSWADNNQGIYYGLEAATEAGRLIQLHDATWNYLAPRPGTDWCRLTDFDGYDHQAEPTLNGRFWLDDGQPVNYNIERSLQAEIYYDYQGTNDTGVDINEFLPDNEAEDIGDYYPGILVGNYARALYPFQLNASTEIGDYTLSTLRNGSTWYQSWFADLDGHPSLSTSGAMDGVDLKCTVFLIRKLWQEGIFDMRQQWIDVSSTINAYNAFSVPGAIARMLTFEYYREYTRVNVVGVALSTGSTAWPNANAGFTLALEYPDGLPDERAHYRVTVSSPGVGSKDFYVNPTGVQLAAVSFTWIDIGILPNPGGSVPDSISGSVVYIDSGGTPHAVSHFSLATS